MRKTVSTKEITQSVRLTTPEAPLRTSRRSASRAAAITVDGTDRSQGERRDGDIK